MDERKIEAPPQRVSAPADHPHPDSRTVSINGAELRIDHGHVSDSIGSPPAANISAKPATPQSQSPSRANSQLLLEAGRILEQLQLQDADLSERQALLEERITEFEAEKRQFHLRQQSNEAALDEQRRKLVAEEIQLANRLTETQSLLAQIDAARLAVEHERADIEKRRESLRDELLAELKSDRQAIDEDRQAVTLEYERAKSLTSSLESRLQEATEEAE